MKVALLFSLAIISNQALAFPEMIRHGYLNCNSCHTTMVGGGLLNEYGRSLSRELLSQPTMAGVPASERETTFAFGLLKTPPWLLLGSDIRLLQTFVDSEKASKGRFMIMQVDVDGSAQLSERWRVFASLGRIEPRTSDPTAKDFVSSPRHGVEYTLTKPDAVNHVTLRVGRFMPAYGIGFAEHPFVTRRLLDFQPGQERFAGELAWANDHTSVIATSIFSQLENNNVRSEKGGILQVSTALGEHSKIGLNYYQTQRNDTGTSYTRRIIGGYANLGLSKQWFALLEVDRPESALQKWGLLQILKVGYEVSPGINLIGAEESANLNTENSNPKFNAYSLGAEWFPRPHWDLYALYRKERDTAISDKFSDVVWLIGHFYL